MKIAALALAALLASATNLVHADEPSASRVTLTLEAPGALTAGAIHFQFKLKDTETGKELTDKDLLIEHERILHLFFFDPALVEFHHVHPSYDGAVWSVDLDVPVNGDYWVWTQGQLAQDQTDFTAGARQFIDGGAPAHVPQALKDIRTGSDGNSVLALSATKIKAKQMVMPVLTVTHKDGTPPALTNYLGAKAHILIVTHDGDAVIHTHPMDMPNPNQLMIHSVFPEAGPYRVWVQFVDGGELKTVALSVIVTP
ncbi:MAG: hypothetical protein ACXWP5_05025 [Bdellovibrionota bacterium]